MGTIAATVAATSTKSGGSSEFTFILLIALVFIGFYFLMIRPQRRRQQQAQQRQSGVSVGARVRTTAGMYATVTAVEGDDVILEVAPDVEVRYMKRAIMEVISPGDGFGGDGVEEEIPADDASYADDEPEDVEDHEDAGSAEEDRDSSRDDDLATSDKD
jgi:preprotein translocase subunit YajC